MYIHMYKNRVMRKRHLFHYDMRTQTAPAARV